MSDKPPGEAPEETEPQAPEAAHSGARTAALTGIAVLLVAVAYVALVMVSGRALQHAPLGRQILQMRSRLEEVFQFQPQPTSLPPLQGTASPKATPSVTQIPSPSPRTSPSVVASTLPPGPNQPSIVTFSIAYENTTGVRLTDVKLTDQIPAGATYQSSSPAGSVSGATIVWNIGTLDPGQKGRVTFQVATTQKGTISNQATITSAEAPPGQVQASAQVG